MLKNKLGDVLGNKSSITVHGQGSLANGEAATVSWEFAGQRTDALTHKELDRDQTWPSAKGGRLTSGEQGATEMIDAAINFRTNLERDSRGVLAINPETGVLEASTERDFEMDMLLRDA